MPKSKLNTAIASVLDFKGFDDYVELFKAGEQTDSRGETRSFTTDDLDDMVRNHEAFPIVIGHPKLDAPAYGWSSDLKRDGDTLLGKFDHVESQFADMVENKRFPNRSVRIRMTDDGFKVAHVGFLGAAAPAIPGLKQVEFAAEDDAVDFEFSGYAETIMARAMRRMREFLIDKFSVEDADKVMPEWELESLTEEAIRERDEDNPDSLFNRHHKDGGATVPKTYSQEELDAALDKQKQDLESDFTSSKDDLEGRLKTERDGRMRTEYSAFVDQAIDDGKLTPAMAAGCVDFMMQLSAETEFEFSQGEGDDKKATKTDAVAWFKDFVGGLGKGVAMGAIDDDDIDADAGADFSAPTGAVVDADRLELHRKAKDYMAKHNCDYVEAVVAVGG